MKFTKPSLPAAYPPSSTCVRRLEPDAADMAQRIRKLTCQVAALQEELTAMRRSTSWRMSAPLRWLGRRRGAPLAASDFTHLPGGTYADWARAYDATNPIPFAQAPLGPSRGSNIAILDEAETALPDDADWLLWLAPGDVLAPGALEALAQGVALHPEARLFYADDDVIDVHGRRSDPRFKPDWNFDLFLAQDFLTPTAMFARSLVEQAGGRRPGPAAGYDLALRCVERLLPVHIHHIPRILCHRSSQELDAAAEARAVERHFEQTATAATVETVSTGRRIRYTLPVQPPLVSLIIPTRNGFHLLRQCLSSIVGRTTYPHYEILVVDNCSDDSETLAYLAELKGQHGFTVIRDDRPFNYSALNNLAARSARGDVLGLINNDIEVISPGWLDEMVSIALQPGVGAVGAKLLFPDETVQHGGVLLGVAGATGIAGHANKFLPAAEPGYMQRNLATQSFSAVTAACLVVRKSLYDQVGGLNEIDLKIAYNDVDFCLRLREAGYRNVWTPYAELFHHESATRGSDLSPDKRERFEREQAYMRSRWADLIANDPAYNPNLTIYAEDFGLAWPPRVPWISGAAKP